MKPYKPYQGSLVALLEKPTGQYTFFNEDGSIAHAWVGISGNARQGRAECRRYLKAGLVLSRRYR